MTIIGTDTMTILNSLVHEKRLFISKTFQICRNESRPELCNRKYRVLCAADLSISTTISTIAVLLRTYRHLNRINNNANVEKKATAD